MTLDEKKCVPCEGQTSLLKEEQIEELASLVPQWEVKDDVIERTFKFDDFVQAIRFADRIAEIAEEQNHHPDLHVSYGKVRVELTTHSVGGLSENDFIVASKIDKLNEK